jgi:hypothetical protein
MSLGGSFTTWSLRPSVPVQFIGLANYTTLLSDRNFYFYLYNTVYLMLGIPVASGAAPGLAVQGPAGALARGGSGSGCLRSLCGDPVVGRTAQRGTGVVYAGNCGSIWLLVRFRIVSDFPVLAVLHGGRRDDSVVEPVVQSQFRPHQRGVEGYLRRAGAELGCSRLAHQHKVAAGLPAIARVLQ